MKKQIIVPMVSAFVVLYIAGRLIPVETKYGETQCFAGTEFQERLLPSNVHALSQPVNAGGAETCVGTPGRIKIKYYLW